MHQLVLRQQGYENTTGTGEAKYTPCTSLLLRLRVSTGFITKKVRTHNKQNVGELFMRA